MDMALLMLHSLFCRVLEVVRPQRVGPLTPSDPQPASHLQGLIQLAGQQQTRAPELQKQDFPGALSSVWSDMATCSYWATLSSSDVSSEESVRLSLKARVLDPLLSEFGSSSSMESGRNEVTVLTRCEVLRVLLQSAACCRSDGDEVSKRLAVPLYSPVSLLTAADCKL